MTKLYIAFKSWWVGDKISEGVSPNWNYLIIAIIVWITLAIILNYVEKKSKKKREYKETKADKKKWNRYGIYAAVIFVPFYILFLIFYAD